MRKEAFLVSTMLVASTAISFAQVKGIVVDKTTNEPLIGVSVVHEKSNTGTVTDLDGKFQLNLPDGRQRLKVSYVGYLPMEVSVTNGDNLNLAIEPDIIALKDVIITSSVSVARKTPIATSTIQPLVIEEKLGNQEFPEILKSTPGVYATKGGGGYGDSKINMRGFQSANVAVMINGVPMNDMEWGGVYWSNWAGLSDVTRSMQTQRGIGASKVSSPSVGGSLNIITKSTDAQQGGMVSYGVGNDGYNKVMFSASTGLLKNGWAMTLLGGKTWGDGYIQGTEFEGYNYFLNISKRINDAQQLSFTIFGAPQTHNQRSAYDGLTIQGWQDVQKYMAPGENYRYNPTYGFGKNGERKTSARNHYHKPQISLNHNWQIDQTSSLSTALYCSIGDGWGYSGQGTSAYSSNWYGTSNGILNSAFRNADGTFAYDQIQELNEQSENGSQMVMSVSKNQHKWFGLLSSYTKEINENLNLMGGIDARYYIGTHTNEIVDLYNGEYYIDRYRANVKSYNNSLAADPNFKNQKLSVGDVVYRDYDGHVLQGGVFGQAEYSYEKINAFAAASVSHTTQWRYDRFYYDAANAKSENVNKLGFTVKGGVNYNINDYHNVFGNVGYISRAPFFSGGAFLQSTTSNEVNKNAVNEKVISYELGYGFRSRYLTANLNVYHTEWNDKTMTRSSDITLADGTPDRAIMNMEGVNATHQGIEVDLFSKPTKWLELTGMFSIGNWRWSNNPTGYFYTSGGEPLNKKNQIASGIKAEDHANMTLMMKDVKVGGSAQTTAALGAKFKLGYGVRIGADWNLFANNYADWAVASNDLIAGSTKEYGTPWKIPTGSTVDLNASYSFKIGKTDAIISGNVNNLFNQEYIVDAYDGGSHSWDTAYRVFYGFGRTMSCRLKISF